ncbi:MAG: sigma-70 family RNA polymerase sigma factor [Lachnospiraceae bacterium]
MDKKQITEYADDLLQTAMYKVQNLSDAQDLVQETMMAALIAIECGEMIHNPKSWLVSVLNRKYYDWLRYKYRKPTVSMDVIEEIPCETDITWRLERTEEALNIRRSLAMLTKSYREVLVRHYMHGQSIKEIAGALAISENTVKSRLYAGRTHMRKEFAMEQYTKQSYEPERLFISISGQQGLNDEPFSIVRNDDKIAMNLLILAYAKPLTLPELAGAIGISTTYIEPIVDKLVDAQLIKRVSDRVYTDFVIFKEEDRTRNNALQESAAQKLYRSIWEIMEEGLLKLRGTVYYQAQRMEQGQKLESFFAVRTLYHAVMDVRDEICGGQEPYEHYPDRPNGGKWYAMGKHYRNDQEQNASRYLKYEVNGELVSALADYCGVRKMAMCSYDTGLGKTHHGYNNLDYVKYPMDAETVLKMLYAIFSGNEDSLPMISVQCMENIEGLFKLGFLTKNRQRKILVDIPVISMEDRYALYRLSEEYDKRISEKFYREFETLMEHPVEVPGHLKSVPKWQRYMWCASQFPMRVICKAMEEGLFLKNAQTLAPAVFLAVEK